VSPALRNLCTLMLCSCDRFRLPTAVLHPHRPPCGPGPPSVPRQLSALLMSRNSSDSHGACVWGHSRGRLTSRNGGFWPGQYGRVVHQTGEATGCTFATP
jgi:hypothetical protein